MGIPAQLTCLLRNLNAGQEAWKALDCYAEAAKFMQRLIKRFGSDAEQDLQFNVLYHLGDWYWQAGTYDDFDLIKDNYKRALSILESSELAGRLCASERDKSICFTRLAQYYHECNTKQSLKLEIYYGEKAHEIDKRLYRANRTPDSARDYMESCMTLSEAYINAGKFDRARELCLCAISIGKEWKKHESSLEAENVLAQNYGVLANVYHAMGGKKNLGVALHFCRMARSVFQRLLESGYEGDCRSNLSCAVFNMGFILCDMGGRKNLERAKGYLEKVFVHDKDLRKRCRSWRREYDFAETNVFLGNVCRALGDPENCVKAAQYYRQAAYLGNSDACFYLGCMHEEGCGVKRSKSKALHYFRVAATNGQKGAVQHLKMKYNVSDEGIME